MELYMMNRVTRPRKYSELSATDAIQVDCDVKATNIILQGLPPKVYALLSNQRIAKELWERIQLLMQGTSLTKQERECKLYDEFDKIAYKKGETLRDFYLRFSLLLNDMNIYNVKLEQFQVNNKFLNTLPPEWSKFVTDVKLQGDDPIDAINHMMSFLSAVVTSRYPTTNNQLRNRLKPGKQATINDGRVTLQPVQGDKFLLLRVPLGPTLQDQVEAILGNKGPLFVTTINGEDTWKTMCEGDTVFDVNVVNHSETEITSDSNIIPYSQYVTESQQESVQNSNSSVQQDALILSPVKIDHLKQTLFEHLKEKKSLMQTVTLFKNDFKKEESRNIDREIALEKKIKQLDNINSMNTSDPSPFCRPTKGEVPKELPKVSMVNTSLKKLKQHLDGFDVVVRERTTATTIIEGSQGFEHTKACFRDEIIPFVKALKDLFNTFDQYLIDELSEVQNVFHQMEQVVEQYRLESKTFKVKMNRFLNENKRLLEQVINKDIVNIITNSSVDNAYVNVHECEKCLKLETERLNKKDFIEKETYDKLFRSFTTLEKHCISLEVDTQLNQEIFQRDNSVSNQSAPTFDQYFELNELKAQSQEKDTVIKKLKERIKSLSGNMNEDKVKKDIEEIKTINIELDHRVSKLIAENGHLK
ncbi:hypothetical protein Tco_0664185 [Tanacetum coccineum]